MNTASIVPRGRGADPRGSAIVRGGRTRAMARQQGSASQIAATEERVTPQSLEAEQSTLGAMMMERDAIARAVEILQTEDFYRQLHRNIFDVIIELWQCGAPVDLITVVEELRRKGQLEEVGGAAYLTALIEACPSAANIENYAGYVLEMSNKRQGVFIADKLSYMGYNGNTSDEIVSFLRESTSLLETRTPDGQRRPTLARLVKRGTNLLQQQLPAPRWAVPDLIPAGLTLFAGKAKTAKSWFMLSCCLAVASGGVVAGKIPVEKGNTLYLGLEDSEWRLQDRLRKSLGNDPMPDTFEYSTEWPRLDEGALELLEEWITTRECPRMIVIDVLQEVRPPRRSGAGVYEDDYNVLRGLKKLGLKHGVAIVAVHHMNKGDAQDVLDAISGSSGMQGSPDNLLVLSRKRGENGATLTGLGKDTEANLAMEWDPNLASWAIVGEADAVQQHNLRADVLRILRDEGDEIHPTEISQMLDKASGHVRVMLTELKKDGLATNIGCAYGKWKATGYAHEPDPFDGDADDTDGENASVINDDATQNTSTNNTNLLIFPSGEAKPSGWWAQQSLPECSQCGSHNPQNNGNGTHSEPYHAGNNGSNNASNNGSQEEINKISVISTQFSANNTINNSPEDANSPTKDPDDLILKQVTQELGLNLSQMSDDEQRELVKFTYHWLETYEIALSRESYEMYFPQWQQGTWPQQE